MCSVIVRPMKPAAQIQAAIELLEQIETERRPADRMLSAYYRSRRYIGSKDKAAISEHVYDVLRQKNSLSWLATQAGLSNIPRSWVMIQQLQKGSELGEYFVDDGYSPKPLSLHEQEGVHEVKALLENKAIDTAPLAARMNIPEWLVPKMQSSLGDDFEAELLAMQNRAGLDIRTNTLKGDRDFLLARLADEGVSCAPTSVSPWGIAIQQKIALANLTSFKGGLFEVQDQGSQLIALAAGVMPGQKVVDFCAGAGGKTLAMAAQMQNKGVIHACDVHSKRLDNLSKRKKRAGAHNIQTRLLSSERDKWVKRNADKMDVVLVDAPCSGTGTWRRSPDARWNLESNNLDDLLNLQESILNSASRMVKPGGRLIYATCSLLCDENEEQITRFLTNHPSFQPAELAEKDCYTGLQVTAGYQLRTSPAKTKMDGFFVAALERQM